jgi:TRAP-type C4-dicarboxylate transport system permease small subunit
MHALRRLLEKLDGAIYQVERALLLLSLVMMTVLVFGDVIVRSFTRPMGKTASFLFWIAHGSEPTAPEVEQRFAELWGPAVFGTLMLLLTVFAVHAARTTRCERHKAPPPTAAMSAGWGIALFLGLTAAVKALVFLFPTGIAGAQRFALGFFVWAGFLGASIATRQKRHIVVDAVKKKLDAVVYPWFSALGAIFTASFTLLLTWLSVHKLAGEIHEWSSNDGVGMFESLPLPTWIVTLALPVTFSLIALRFLAQGMGDLLYGPVLNPPEDELSKELKKLDETLVKETAAEEQHDTALLYGAPHPGNDGRPVKKEALS